MLIRKFVFAMLLAAAALPACATDDDSVARGSSATIQSSKELDAHIQNTPDSPLHRLSSAAKQRFVASLVFTEKGLGGYHYADLQAELSPEEIHDVLSLFGMERTTSLVTGESTPNATDRTLKGRPPRTDHKGYKCSGPGSCYADVNSICTSNC